MTPADITQAIGLLGVLSDIDADMRAVQAAQRITVRTASDMGGSFSRSADTTEPLGAELCAAWLRVLDARRHDIQISLIRLGVSDIPPSPLTAREPPPDLAPAAPVDPAPVSASPADPLADLDAEEANELKKMVIDQNKGAKAVAEWFGWSRQIAQERVAAVRAKSKEKV